MTYAFPGGLPRQDADPEQGAVFTQAYAFIPASVQTDIVTSFFPNWVNTKGWILARPLTGFAETFAQYAMLLDPNGGSDTPEPDADAQAVLFVAHGNCDLIIGGEKHALRPGSYVYIPAQTEWSLWNKTDLPCGVHWLRKRYVPADGIAAPKPLITHDNDKPILPMPDCGDLWGTQRFVDPTDLSYDFHANVVTFQPGGRIPFAETHVMEHGIYVLEGTARYLLNQDWVDVVPGDFMWLRAFCPQACVATGDRPFRYLLYKDVNRHPSLILGG